MMRTGPKQSAPTHQDMQVRNSFLHVLQLQSRLFPSHLSGLSPSSSFPPATHGTMLLILHSTPPPLCGPVLSQSSG